MGKRGERDGQLIRGRGKIDLRLLAALTRRPQLYEQQSRSFWTDPYVSRHVLEAHLDPHIEDASRKAWQIQASVERICDHAAQSAAGERSVKSASPRLLDLACGPGLYANQFAARGFRVVGIDFAETSIAHARREAQREGLSIDYRTQSFLTAEFDGPYDVVTMIYGEFCTLTESERHTLLDRIHNALRPGGLFAFDVFTSTYVDRLRRCDDFYVSEGGGFWQKAPHVVIEQVFHYPQASASVSRYTLVEADGAYRQFSVWWRSFGHDEVASLLDKHGFAIEAAYGSIWGDQIQSGDEWIGLYARRST